MTDDDNNRILSRKRKFWNYYKIEKRFYKENFQIIGYRLFGEILFKYILYPIDRIRLIKQTNLISGFNNYNDINNKLKQNKIGYYNNNFLRLFLILTKLPFKILMVNTTNVVFLKKGEKNYSKHQIFLRKAAAFLTTSFIYSLFFYPLERLRLLTAININPEFNKINIFRIFKKEGLVFGLYKGMFLDLITKFPEFYLMFFLHYNISNKNDNIHNIYYEYFLSSLLLYPLKTFKKTYIASSKILNKNIFYSKSLIEKIKIFNKKGFSNLYSGFGLYFIYTGSFIFFQKNLIQYLNK